MVSTERLTAVILNALPSETYSVIKQQAIRDPDLSLVDVECMMLLWSMSIMSKSRQVESLVPKGVKIYATLR